MPGNWSSLAPPTSSVAPPPTNTSQFPPLPDWEAPSFTRAAQFRVGATFVLFLFAACSNLALLASVWCGRGRRLASHLRPLMLSLAAADLVMTFVVMPLDAVWNVTVQWYAGDALCKLLCFLKLFAMHASAFVLVVISLDRQHAILRPLDALTAHRRNRVMLLLAWSLSLLLASPQLFIFRAIRVEAVDFTQCATHGSFSRRWQETVYNMFHFTTLYVVPLLVMSCCYSRILLHIHLQHLRDKGESYLRRSGTDIIPKARMKTLKMTVVIVLSFVVCWTPYYLLGIWYWFQPDMLRVTPEYVHHGLFVFGNLNTCCDPVIYGFYTPSFRADLAACCRRARRRTPPPTTRQGADPATHNQAGGGPRHPQPGRRRTPPPTTRQGADPATHNQAGGGPRHPQPGRRRTPPPTTRQEADPATHNQAGGGPRHPQPGRGRTPPPTSRQDADTTNQREELMMSQSERVGEGRPGLDQLNGIRTQDKDHFLQL